MTEDPKYRIYLEEIASLFAKGLSPEHVAIKYDIELAFVEKVLADPQFEEIFSTVDPKAYEAWKATQNEQVSRKRVKAQINEDAATFYKIASDLVKDKNSTLTDREKLDFAIKLLSLSDGAKKDQEVEHVIMSEHQLHTIAETLRELDGNR